MKFDKVDWTPLIGNKCRHMPRLMLHILDDIGLKRQDDLTRLDLLKMVEYRHGRKSMIVVS